MLITSSFQVRALRYTYLQLDFGKYDFMYALTTHVKGSLFDPQLLSDFLGDEANCFWITNPK